VAPTGGGHVGLYRDPGSGSLPTAIQSGNGTIVLADSALGAAVVANTDGMAGGYQHYVALGNTAITEATSYKSQQNGETVPWDLRFDGVVNIGTGADRGSVWPNWSNPGTQNFDEQKLRNAAEFFRVAIRANPYDLQARQGLARTYSERIQAHLFAGNNAVQWASVQRLTGGYVITDEATTWNLALGCFKKAGDLFQEANDILPDAETFGNPVYSAVITEPFELFGRGLVLEAEAIQSWLRLAYLASYQDPITRAFNPGTLLGELQPHLDRLEARLLLASRYTHLPNYLTVDLASVSASLAYLYKQRNTTIPAGRVSFVGRRSVDRGEFLGEYEPRYIPFLPAGGSPGQESYSSFFNILGYAEGQIALAKSREDLASVKNIEVIQNRAQLKTKLEEIYGDYNTQLADLCGTIRGTDGQLHPDIVNSLLPPGDREEAHPFGDGEERGKIYSQHIAIEEAKLNLAAAEQDRRNIYLKAVNAKTVGELIANQSENLAQMYLTDGASLAALEELRGKETARVARETARLQAEEAERKARKSLFSKILKAVAVGIAAAVVTTSTGGLGITAASAIQGVVAGGLDLHNSNTQATDAHRQAALIRKTGDLQADLALINADIERQRQLINARQASTVQFAQRDQTLWKTEEAWQAAMLDYERSELNVLMAELRVAMMKAELQNMHGRVAYLLQEQRKAVVLHTQDVNPMARPDYRLSIDYGKRVAEDTYLVSQEALYLAAKALQYKLNDSDQSGGSQHVVSDRIESILRARNAATLELIVADLKRDHTELYWDKQARQTITFGPVSVRHFLFQNNRVQYESPTSGNILYSQSALQTSVTGTNSLTASDADWLAFLQSRLLPDGNQVKLLIPFSTDLIESRPDPTAPGFSFGLSRINPLFALDQYSGTIHVNPSKNAYGIWVNIRGRGLSSGPGNITGYLRQKGASYLRTDKARRNANAIRVWNLLPAQRDEVGAIVTCTVNSTAPLPNTDTAPLHERSPSNDRWELEINSREGLRNGTLLSELDKIVDIELYFTVDGFTN
jgi:hypothetical protein